MTIGFALCGSFCTYNKVFPIIEILSRDFAIVPILSEAGACIDSRFGSGIEHIQILTELCGRPPILGIPDAEPIGPKKMLDALVIAPCTGNTLAKLSHGIADGPVTMAAKSHLRNGRPVILAVSTNDALGTAAENIGRLLVRKNVYFVPFGQDDPIGKPTSMVADFGKIPLALEEALSGRQVQPLIL